MSRPERLLARTLLLVAGVVASIGLHPGTSWSFRNQLDGLTGVMGKINPVGYIDHTNAEQYHGEPGPKFWPPQLAPPRGDELMDAIMAASTQDENPSPTRLEPLQRYCREHPNEAGSWAHLARLAHRGYWVPSRAFLEYDVPPTPKDILEANAREREIAVEAISNGLRLEPGNAYFHILSATALRAGGHILEAQKAWAVAAGCERYDNHVLEEGKLRLKTAAEVLGYRGEFSRWINVGAMQVPHRERVRRAVIEFPWRSEGVQELQLRRNIILTMAIVSRDCNDMLESMGAAATSNMAAMRQPMPKRKPHEARDQQFGQRWFESQARSLDRALAEKGLKSDVSMVDLVRTAASRREALGAKWANLYFEPYGMSYGTATATLVLLLSLLALFSGGLIRLIRWPPKVRPWWLDLVKLIVLTTVVVGAGVWFIHFPSVLNLALLLGTTTLLGGLAGVGSRRLAIGGAILLGIVTAGYVVAIGWDVKADGEYAAATRLLLQQDP
jgi:hypothetical protein